MALNRSFTLNTGAEIPAVGFGTWQAAPHEVEDAVEIALKAGYRHLDCAAIYRNEQEVGRGIQKSGVDRKDIFITTKLWNTKHDPQDVEAALDQSLRDLGVDYVDLYLIHWPVVFAPGDRWFPLDEQGVFQLADIPIVDTWKALEALLKTGKTRAIGVSNFNIRRLQELLSQTTVVPAVNQVEAHPYLQQPDLLEFCKKNGILVEAYSPLGNNTTGEPKVVDDPKVQELAQSLNVDPGQLLVSWAVQRDTIALPKSVTEKRIRSNFQDVVLPDDAVKKLNALERHKRFNFPGRWGYDIFDEVGEKEVRKIAQESAADNLQQFT